MHSHRRLHCCACMQGGVERLPGSLHLANNHGNNIYGWRAHVCAELGYAHTKCPSVLMHAHSSLKDVLAHHEVALKPYH